MFLVDPGLFLGCYWLLLVVTGCYWVVTGLLRVVTGLLLVATGCYWLFLVVPGCSCLHLVFKPYLLVLIPYYTFTPVHGTKNDHVPCVNG